MADASIKNIRLTVLPIHTVGGEVRHGIIRKHHCGWLSEREENIAAVGKADNSMGIGARIGIFSGSRRQTWQVSGATGYLSQGPPEILAGLA